MAIAVVSFWNTSLAIPIALYRPQIGPPARNGKKMAEKWILAPPGKREKNGRKMGKLAQKWTKNGSDMAIFPFFGHFFPFCPVGPKSIFWPFFSHFGPEARFGVCTGQSGSQHQPLMFEHQISGCPKRLSSGACSWFPLWGCKF